MDNSFRKSYESNPRPYLYIKLLPKSNAQEAMKFLGEIIIDVCNCQKTKNSIVLDCTDLKNVTNLSSLKLSEILKLGYRPVGLEQFFIVTKSVLIKTFAKGIIKVKKAQEYTHVCKTGEDALASIME